MESSDPFGLYAYGERCEDINTRISRGVPEGWRGTQEEIMCVARDAKLWRVIRELWATLIYDSGVCHTKFNMWWMRLLYITIGGIWYIDDVFKFIYTVLLFANRILLKILLQN